MARPFFTSVSLISLFASQALAIAIPTPASRFEKRAPACVQAAPLGYITPSPGCQPVTVTTQGQAVTSYIPTALVCRDGTNRCETQYQATTYHWYSTYLPVYPYGEPMFVSRGDQVITLPPREQPKYAVATMACATPGVYTVGGEIHNVVQAPTEILYVKEVERSYATCQAHDYFLWLQQLGQPQNAAAPANAGYTGGQLAVNNFQCREGNCASQHQNLYVNVQTEVREIVVASTFTGWCHKRGACEVFAFDPRCGRVSITISVDAPGPCTTQATITTSATVTSTSTMTSNTATIAPTASVEPSATGTMSMSSAPSTSATATDAPVLTTAPTTTAPTTTSPAPTNPAQCTAVNTAANIIANPGFETGGLTPWTAAFAGDGASGSVQNSGSNSGTYAFAATINTNDSVATLSQTIVTCPGRTYSGTARVNLTSANAGCTLTVRVGTGAVLATQGETGAGYVSVPFSFAATGASSAVTFTVNCTAAPGSALIDDVSVTDA